MPLKVLVVGGGPGGLAAALLLARNGHDVTLFEQSTARNTNGYAFTLTSNTIRCIKKSLDLDPVDAGGVIAHGLRHFTHQCELFGEYLTSDTVLMHQPGFQQQLLTAALAAGVHVQDGTRMVSADASTTSLTLSDGSAVSADLILGVDGVHSVVRPSIVADVPKDSGRSAIRFLIPMATIDAVPTVKARFGSAWNTSYNHPSARVIIAYPCSGGTQLNVVCLHPTELSAAYTSTVVPLQVIESIYADFHPEVREMLSLAPADARVYPLQDLDDIAQWSSGGIALLGDAAHAVLPVGFSGTSMALEDAAVLGVLLSGAIERDQLRGRLEAYESIRKGRVGQVRDYSREPVKTAEGFDVYMAMLEAGDVIGDAKRWVSEHDEALQ